MKDKNTSGVLMPNLNCAARLRVLAILGVSLCALVLPERAMADEPRARATITFETGDSVTIQSGRRQFRPVEILPGETVQIYLQLPPGFANTLVAPQAMDGGLTSGGVVVEPDGTVAIAFQAAAQPGLYRLLLSAHDKTAMLQFWVPASEKR